MSDRLVKNAILARSGVYQYTRGELRALGLSDPPKWIGDKEVFNVFRPAPVIAVAVERGKFNHLPLTTPHPPEFVDRENFREYAVGWTGDKASMEYLADIDEAVVRSTVVIGDAEAAEAYEKGVKELSHGYMAEFRWRGEKEGGTFDAVMTQITDGNHMALVPRGRAGAAAAILDRKGAGVGVKQIMSGLFRYAKLRRRLVMDKAIAKDDFGPVGPDKSEVQSKGFGDGLWNLIQTRATLSEAEVESKVDELKKLLDDLPGGDEKSLLMRYMEDMKLMKGEDDDTLYQVKGIVCALVEKLDRSVIEEAEGEDEVSTETGTVEKPTAGTTEQPAPAKTEGKVGDEPGATPAPPQPPAGPAAAEGEKKEEKPAAAAPAPAASQATPAAGGSAPQPGSPPQVWADALFNFLDAMRADLEAQKKAGAAQAPAVGAAPAQTPASAAPAAPAASAAPPAAPAPTDAKSDPPPEAGVPVKKPDGSDKPGKPDGKSEMTHPGTSVDGEPMSSVNTLDEGVNDSRGGGIEEVYQTMKGGK